MSIKLRPGKNKGSWFVEAEEFRKFEKEIVDLNKADKFPTCIGSMPSGFRIIYFLNPEKVVEGKKEEVESFVASEFERGRAATLGLRSNIQACLGCQYFDRCHRITQLTVQRNME